MPSYFLPSKALKGGYDRQSSNYLSNTLYASIDRFALNLYVHRVLQIFGIEQQLYFLFTIG